MIAGQLKIRTYGSSCLRMPSEQISEIGVSERMLADALIKAMYEGKGIGLAAPQVGINKQLFVVDIGDGTIAVFNPKIIKTTGEGMMEEGCLCFPNIVVNVSRPQIIEVEYMDINNQTVKKILRDLMARVFMHESDHLFGKLIVDYASEKELAGLKSQLEELEQQNKDN
ncbi:MAG: peptide deformylase [Candidatus Omnitrophica bacterium]|nr:peptide deformylase [Candidatus Omnitrophota bacterium]